jgi:hypothetical protein
MKGKTDMPAVYRQGDVLIVATDSIPKSVEPVVRDKDRVVLAYGEVTGHAHAILDKRASLFRDPKLAKIFMLVGGDGPVALTHEEHSTVNIPPGKYEIRHQREYSPEAIRRVAD